MMDRKTNTKNKKKHRSNIKRFEFSNFPPQCALALRAGNSNNVSDKIMISRKKKNSKSNSAFKEEASEIKKR